MSSNFRPIQGFLQNGAINQLLSAAHAQNQLLNTIKGLLPEPIGAHCAAAVHNEQGLTLFADSSAWASRIRYLSRNIKQKLRDKGLPVKDVRVRVLIENRNFFKSHTRARRVRLSAQTATLIESLADGMANPEQREILLKISKSAQNRR